MHNHCQSFVERCKAWLAIQHTVAKWYPSTWLTHAKGWLENKRTPLTHKALCRNYLSGHFALARYCSNIAFLGSSFLERKYSRISWKKIRERAKYTRGARLEWKTWHKNFRCSSRVIQVSRNACISSAPSMEGRGFESHLGLGFFRVPSGFICNTLYSMLIIVSLNFWPKLAGTTHCLLFLAISRDLGQEIEWLCHKAWWENISVHLQNKLNWTQVS